MKQRSLWITEYWKRSAMFSDQQQLIEKQQWQTWPDCNELNRLMPEGNKTLSGHLTRFFPQSSLAEDASYYEEHIFSNGEIPTRDQNWHDYFNAMVWLQFPKIKSVINALHVKETELQSDKKNRTRKRDALTLFDESGVIFVSSDDQIIEALKDHQWKELFWQKRDEWWQSISVYIFGHGLYEKALSPYIGMTANALTLNVDDHFFDQDRQLQINELDQIISNKLQTEKVLENPRDLTPLPMLGVPDWWQENEQEDFYNNQNYFRSKRI